MKEERTEVEPYIAPEIARGLEQTQIGIYHTPGGHGFAVEDANILADRRRLKKVVVTGTSYEVNGADRIADGILIQTKYYQTADKTIRAAFDGETGRYRYQGQVLEVPKDQYPACLNLMQKKIAQGQVPGVTDPHEATRIVKQGDVTYTQARNIAKAGNIDSLVFDAKTQAVTTSYLFAISFAIHFAKRKWTGDETKAALTGAVESAVAAGGTTLVTGIFSAQILRSQAAAIGAVAARNGVQTLVSTSGGKKIVEYLAQASLGKVVYGAAAANHVAKLLRSNIITSTVATAVVTAPDFYRAAVARSISWAQLTKNLVVNASGVAAGAGGWMGGAAAGVALGSAVPIIGTAVGGILGGIIGALAGGYGGSAVAKEMMDRLVEDDAKRMLSLLQVAVEDLACDYLLTESEINQLSLVIEATADDRWLHSMYQTGATTDSDQAWQTFAYTAFDPACLAIVRKRPKVTLPAAEHVQAEIVRLARAVAIGEPEIPDQHR